MKSRTKLRAVAFAAATLGMLSSSVAWAQAQFANREVDQNRFLTVAAPGSALVPYSLYLIEQRTDARPCFQVSGSNPGEVNPLWTTFDFTGICGRASDSNGYSIRVNNEDLGPAYRLRIKQSGDDLLLVGEPRRGSSLLIGRADGVSSTGYTEIDLLPGWRVTQRVYQGSPLGHFYYTNNATLAELTAGGDVAVDPTPTPTPPTPTPTPPVPFPDVRGDIYATEIARAVEIGFVAGFQDGTFKPTRPVTREEAVSMVVEAIQEFLPAGAQLSSRTGTGSPFPDVAANRWSAEKIGLLKEAGIVSGDDTGLFRPADTITRAELMAMLRKTALVYRTKLGLLPELQPTTDVQSFSDIGGHWAQDTITRMSGYCGVATAYNETGSAFRPNTQALRNYTAAAIQRLFDCGATPQ